MDTEPRDQLATHPAAQDPRPPGDPAYAFGVLAEGSVWPPGRGPKTQPPAPVPALALPPPVLESPLAATIRLSFTARGEPGVIEQDFKVMIEEEWDASAEARDPEWHAVRGQGVVAAFRQSYVIGAG